MNRLSLLVIVLLFFSCASRKTGWEKSSETIKLTQTQTTKLGKTAGRNWKSRHIAKNLLKSLDSFEKLHKSDPSNLSYLIYLTRGYYFYADAHLEDEEEKKKYFNIAAAWGEKAMATNRAFAKKMAKDVDVEDALETLTKKEVPAIYWSAAALGKWAKASGIAAALQYKTQIKGMISRVEELDPDYFHSAPSRYWGGFYAVAPSFAGGDMKKSLERFQRSIKEAPHYLGTRVLLAHLYYVKKGDQKNFEKELKKVLKANVNVVPSLKPENIMEQKKAKKLLKMQKELF